MRAHGHPVVGAIAGFFFLLFLGVELLTFGVLALDSKLLVVLPILGLVLGIAFALWAPLGRRPAPGGAVPPPAEA